MLDPRETVGTISERTLQNVRRARTWGFWLASVHIEAKGWTGGFRLRPRYSDRTVDWWERVDIYKVRWITIYWLTGAISLYWRLEPDPHERMNHHV